jgi:hypothetical protein
MSRDNVPTTRGDESPRQGVDGGVIEKASPEATPQAERATEAHGTVQGGASGNGKPPLINWRKLLGSITVKDILGILGVIGNAVGFILKLKAVYVAGIVFVSCLFLLIWGLLERKNTKRFLRAVALFALVIGGAGCVYYAAVGVTLLTGEPERIGSVFDTKVEDIELKGEGLVELVSREDYRIRFAKTADYVQTVFSVAPVSAGDVRDLNLIYERQQGDEDKVFKSGESIEVKQPETNLELPVLLVVELQRKVQDPKVSVHVVQKYAQRNLLWRFRKWVHEHYS